MNITQKTGYTVIGLARRMLSGTPVQEYRLTAYTYKKITSLMYKGEETETIFREIKLRLPLKDKAIVPSILGGYFEKVELSIFEDIAVDSGVFLDVGANVGIYSIIASSLSSVKNNRVYAFEPVPENIAYLKKNIELNNISNIQITEKAVGEKNKTINLVLAKDSIATHSTSIKHAKGSIQNVLKVDVIALDDFVMKYKIRPDIIKVDVEGYDEKVVRGGMKTIRKYKPTIFIEFDPDAILDSRGDPEYILNELAKVYDYELYMINESKKFVARADIEELRKKKIYGNSNLIFTNSQKHRSLIEASPFYKSKIG